MVDDLTAHVYNNLVPLVSVDTLGYNYTDLLRLIRPKPR